jgi:RNA polymerase sigma-70 factor (ECF subfamily)
MRPESLDSIYQLYMKDVYRYLCSLCANRQDAEDLVQETFYRAYLYLENCPADKVKPWLFRVAYNAFVDMQRKGSRSNSYDPESFSGLSDDRTPEDALLHRERWEEISRMVSLLPDNQRHALLLHDFHHLPYREAAEIMGIGLSHFKILLFRARQNLRLQNERMNPDE